MHRSVLACLHSLDSRLQTLEAHSRFVATSHELEMANGNAAARELVDEAVKHAHRSSGRQRAIGDSAARLARALPGLDQATFDMELRQAVSGLPTRDRYRVLSFAHGALSQAYSRLHDPPLG